MALARLPTEYEPLPRFYHISGCVGSKILVQGGRTKDFSEKNRKKLSSVVEIFDPYSELWEQRQLNGEVTLPAKYSAATASLGDYLFSFGGTNRKVFFNSVHKLDTNTWCWSQLSPQSADGAPMPKIACGLIAYRNRLAVFGGRGLHQEPTEPHTLMKDTIEWTNEFHIYDLTQGLWSCPATTGETPPPCSGFTFTAIDSTRAVVFGGRNGGKSCMNSVHVIDLSTMNWCKLDTPKDSSWPEERCYHAACCLNYGQAFPQLLVTGGLDRQLQPLADAWIMDIEGKSWRKESITLKGRWGHSLTAFSLGPGLTEVVEFGGCPEQVHGSDKTQSKNLIADTNILKFRLCGESQWLLHSVVSNKHRGTPQERIIERLRYTAESWHRYANASITLTRIERQRLTTEREKDREEKKEMKQKIAELEDGTERMKAERGEMILGFQRERERAKAEKGAMKSEIIEAKQRIRLLEKERDKVERKRVSAKLTAKARAKQIGSKIKTDEMEREKNITHKEETHDSIQVLGDLERDENGQRKLHDQTVEKGSESSIQTRAVGNGLQQVVGTSKRDKQCGVVAVNNLTHKQEGRVVLEVIKNKIIAEKTLTVTNDEQCVNLEGYGLRLDIPQNSLPEDCSQLLLQIEISRATDYRATDEDGTLVSLIYTFRHNLGDRKLRQPVTLEMQHCVANNTNTTLCIMQSSQVTFPFKFHIVSNRKSSDIESYGAIELDHFCSFAVYLRWFLSSLFWTLKPCAVLYYTNIKLHSFHFHLYIAPQLDAILKEIDANVTEKNPNFERGPVSPFEFGEQENQAICLKLPQEPVSGWIMDHLNTDEMNTEDIIKMRSVLIPFQVRVKWSEDEGEPLKELTYDTVITGTRKLKMKVVSPDQCTENTSRDSFCTSTTSQGYTPQGSFCSSTSQECEPVDSISPEDFGDLPPPEQRDLMEFVGVDVQADWEQVGLGLGLEPPTLRTIAQDCQHASGCMRRVFTEWQYSGTSEYSWKHLAKVLSSRLVSKRGLLPHMFERVKKL